MVENIKNQNRIKIKKIMPNRLYNKQVSPKGYKKGGRVKKANGGPGLYANIAAKKARIKAGSGETMKSPGSKGAPTAANFKRAAQTART